MVKVKENKYERYYLYLILTLALVLNWIVEGTSNFGKSDLNLGLLPKKSIIIIEVLQVFLLSYLLLFYKKYKFIIVVTFSAVLFVAFEFIIHYIFGNSITVWISGIRYYLSFSPLFLLGYVLSRKGYKIDREFNFLIFLLFLQVPVAIYQFLKAPILFTTGGASLFDAVSGTMGGFATNLLSAVLCFGIIYFLIRYLSEKKNKYLLYSIFLIIPPIIASAKGMYVVLIGISIYLFFSFKVSINNLLKYAFIFIVLVFGFTYAYNTLDYGQKVSLDFLIQYTQEESGRGRLSRTESISYATNLLIDEQSPLFGMGIGSANSNPLGDSPPYNNAFTIRHSLDTLITETGLIGLILIIFFTTKLFLVSQRVRKRLHGIDTFNSNLACLLGGMILVFVMGLFWTDILFRVQFMYPFGLLAGYILGTNTNIKSI